MNYSEKLKDPRWQKKRLEILERDAWECTNCGDKDKTLHVHHKAYNKNPWDAKDDDLETLCEDCHKTETKRKKKIKEVVALLDDWGGEDIEQVYLLLWGLEEEKSPLGEGWSVYKLRRILEIKWVFDFAFNQTRFMDVAFKAEELKEEEGVG